MLHPRRVPFVDIARAAAILAMIQGHVAHALLAPDHQQGVAFAAWLFLRGLTSCFFLVLAGFSFALISARPAPAGRPRLQELAHRARRYGLLLLLGYALHLPVKPVWRLSAMTPEQWRSLFAVDVLQVVAVTLIGLHACQWIVRTPRRLEGAVLLGTALVAGLTPVAWSVERWLQLPGWLLAYLTGTHGSHFPLFPWSAYILVGAVFGLRFVRLRDRAAADEPGPADGLSQALRRSAARRWAIAGAAMLGLGVASRLLPYSPYGAIDFWTVSPSLFLVRAGLVAMLLAAVARMTDAGSAPAWVVALSRQSLMVYVVHLAIVYGSIWNEGLRLHVGPVLGPGRLILHVLLVSAAMVGLAWAWDRWVPNRGVAAVGVRGALAVVLVWPLV